VAGGIGFRPENPPPAYIYIDRRRKFLGRTAFTVADRRRFWPETIKSPDFYGFRAFLVAARDALTLALKRVLHLTWSPKLGWASNCGDAGTVTPTVAMRGTPIEARARLGKESTSLLVDLSHRIKMQW
jgi:hypothetical protein